MSRLKTTGVSLILVTLFLVSLFPMASPAGADDTPCIKWVRVGEPSVNPNNELTEFRGGGSTPGYYTNARYDGKFDLYDVSETSFDVHTRAWDRGLFWDVNMGCTFDAPPEELIPGESYDLTVDFTHSVVEYNEVPRYFQRFGYSSDNPGIWIEKPEGLWDGYNFAYEPWHPDFTGENSKTWTLDVIEKGAPFYPAPGATWQLNASWGGINCCWVTWTYEAQEIQCDTEASIPEPINEPTSDPTETQCSQVILEHIFNAGVRAGWAQMHAYWHALEAEPTLIVGTSEANDIIADLTALREHLEVSGFPFNNYDIPIDSLIANLRSNVRTVATPEGIASLIVDSGGLQAQLKGKGCTMPDGQEVTLEHIFNAGVRAGWAQIHAYWHALEAEPPLVVGTSEANDIITDLAALGDHLEASGFPFDNYDIPIDNLIANLRSNVRTVATPEGIASLIVDSGGLQTQLRGKTCNTCGEDVTTASPSPTPTTATSAPTLTFESRSKATGSSIQIPLTLSGVREKVGNMDITLSYNPSILTATEVIKGSLTGNSLFDYNIQNGTILISLAHNQGFRGNGSTAYIRFNVIGTAGSTSPLSITDLTANIASDMVSMNIAAVDGTFTVLDASDEEAIADCNGDGKLTVLDALCALQMAVGKKTEDLTMDINGDGKVTSLDAKSILKIALENV